MWIQEPNDLFVAKTTDWSYKSDALYSRMKILLVMLLLSVRGERESEYFTKPLTSFSCACFRHEGYEYTPPQFASNAFDRAIPWRSSGPSWSWWGQLLLLLCHHRLARALLRGQVGCPNFVVAAVRASAATPSWAQITEMRGASHVGSHQRVWHLQGGAEPHWHFWRADFASPCAYVVIQYSRMYLATVTKIHTMHGLCSAHLCPQLFYLFGELITVLRILPLGSLLALHHLQEMQVLVLELFHLQVQLVEANRNENSIYDANDPWAWVIQLFFYFYLTLPLWCLQSRTSSQTTGQLASRIDADSLGDTWWRSSTSIDRS